MSCDEVRDLLPDYALGAVSDIQGAAVRRHLRGCASCRAESERLDEGLTLFAAAAHEAEPPEELEARVLRVLKDEWADPEPGAAPAPRRLGLSRRALLAIAAAFVLIAGALAWGTVNQVRASRLASDAGTLRSLLDTLGGKDVRVGRLNPAKDSLMQGSFLIYDGSGRGDSWVLVLVEAPGYTGEADVKLLSQDGKAVPMRAITVEGDGEGWTGLFSQSDLSQFDSVEVSAPSGSLLAAGQAIQHHH